MKTIRQVVAIPIAILSMTILGIAAITSFAALALASLANWVAHD